MFVMCTFIQTCYATYKITNKQTANRKKTLPLNPFAHVNDHLLLHNFFSFIFDDYGNTWFLVGSLVYNP